MTAVTHVKAHKVPYLIALLVPILPLLTGIVGTYNSLDRTLSTHIAAEDLKITGLSEAVDQILELQLAREIRDLMQLRCDRPSISLDNQINRLQSEYRKVALPPQNYPQITCRNVA